MGNSQQKEEIEKFHNQKLMQLQNEAQNKLINISCIQHNERMIRSKSMPIQTQINKIQSPLVILQANHNINPQNMTRTRSTSQFKPVIKQIIIKQQQQTPILKIISPIQVSNSKRVVYQKNIQQVSPILVSTMINNSHQNNIVSPLSFSNKRQIQCNEEQSINQSPIVSQFDPIQSIKKSFDNKSPIKRNGNNLKVDHLLQEIKPTIFPAIKPAPQQKAKPTQINFENSSLDFNLKQIKPLSFQLQISQLTNQLKPESENLESSQASKGSNQLEKKQKNDDKLFTPPRQQTKKDEIQPKVNTIQNINNYFKSNSVSIKEQFEQFDNDLQKQIKNSQNQNMLQIKDILKQQDKISEMQDKQSIQQQQSNEEDHRFTKNSFQNNIRDFKNQLVYSKNISQSLQNEQEQITKNIKFNSQSLQDIQKIINIKQNSLSQQQQINSQNQNLEGSIDKKIIFSNEKSDLSKKVQEQQDIQKVVLDLQEQQRVYLEYQNSKQSFQSQQQANKETNQEELTKNLKLSSTDELKNLTNNQNILEKNKKNYQHRIINVKTETDEQQQQIGIMNQQHISPIQTSQQNSSIINAGLISPNNNQIIYYRSKSLADDQLDQPTLLTHQQNLQQQIQDYSNTTNSNKQLIQNEEFQKQYQENIFEENQNDLQNFKQFKSENGKEISTNNVVSNRPDSVLTDIDHVRMASVKVMPNKLSPLARQAAQDIYYHQEQWNSKDDSDFIFQQNMQSRLLETRLDDDQDENPQTPPSYNINTGNQSKNNSSVSSAYTFNQKTNEKNQNKNKICHFTLKIDSIKKEVIRNSQSEKDTDTGNTKESTMNKVEQMMLNKDLLQVNPFQENSSVGYQINNNQRETDIVKSIDNIQENVKKSILKSHEMLSQTQNSDSKANKQIYQNKYEDQEEVELEPYNNDYQNEGSEKNQQEKSPIRKSKIKIYHGKIEHIKMSQQNQPENLILYKLDEQMNALIPVVLDNDQDKEISQIQPQMQSSSYNNSPLKTYQSLLREEFGESKNKEKNICNKQQNYDDILMDRNNRWSSGNKKDSQKVKNYSVQNQTKASNSKVQSKNGACKYFQHQQNPDIKDNAYHQILMQYSDKKLTQISKAILVPNSYGYQHLTQKMYKQKQQNENFSFSGSSKKQKQK